MKIAVLPQTAQGRWSGGLAVAFIVLIGLKIRGAMPLPTFAMAAMGLTGFALALSALFRHKDRSLACLLAILVGVLILFWTAAELAFPH